MDSTSFGLILKRELEQRCIIAIEILWQRPPCGETVSGVTESRGEWQHEFTMPRSPKKGDVVYVGGITVDINSVIWQADASIWSLSAGSITYTVDHELNTALDALAKSTWSKM